MSPENAKQESQASAVKNTAAHISARSLLSPTIQAWRYFLEDQGASPHTVKAFLADLKLLATYLPSDRTLGEVTTYDITNYLEWLQGGRGVPCSPKTLSRRITSVKAFFRWLHDNGILLIDPAEKVPQKSVISPLPTALTPEEQDALLDAADKQRHAAKPDARSYLLLELLLETGIKKGECVTIDLNHIDLQAEGGPLLYVRYASPQNRYKERKVGLSEAWVEALEEYKAQYAPQDRLFAWSQRRLEYLLEDLGVEAGLSKHVSFDMCRWTCALNDWQAGVDHNKIRQKLGISKIQWREVSMKLEKLAAA
jgi:site-specific recombinase XerD